VSEERKQGFWNWLREQVVRARPEHATDRTDPSDQRAAPPPDTVTPPAAVAMVELLPPEPGDCNCLPCRLQRTMRARNREMAERN
jgi:hypothetical protein